MTSDLALTCAMDGKAAFSQGLVVPASGVEIVDEGVLEPEVAVEDGAPAVVVVRGDCLVSFGVHVPVGVGAVVVAPERVALRVHAAGHKPPLGHDLR